ncbi:hypothetical protein HBH77_094940 [Parastagonospora nodorum]|nr:hypothetical protein HBH46_182080 [Parastagonospora nodorum]KAH5092808.1 hypothetical protein HBH72_183620 [Parastagonospora nodorum]KAH5206682.1 hypothetical protein HBH77_094940 [Parastagonospora nodorum]KAH5290284.1 hypothetical protein HBI11_212360 [Parastagonospora nodorum]KAH5299797.1 hypothetical protein HBI50_210420 [Parastagonospora nodorum]
MYYPFQEDAELSFSDQVAMLPVSAREELLQIKKNEQDWHPNTWSLWSDKIASYGSDDYSVHNLSRHKARNHKFEEDLAKFLTCFKNVDCLHYLHEPAAIPGRYRDLFKDEDTFREAIPSSFRGSGSDLNAHLGSDVILTACALSELRPCVLELAVDLDKYHAFVTSLPQEVLSAVSSRVEDLQLFDSCRGIDQLYHEARASFCFNNSFCPFYGHYDAQTQMPRGVITKEVFPALQSLTIDHMSGMPGSYLSVAPLPSLSDLPKITHLAVKGTRQTEATLLAFVERHGKDLQSVTLKGVAEDSYDLMLNVLRQFNLKKLKIVHVTDKYWNVIKNRFFMVNDLFEALQKDRIRDVADETILQHEGLVKALEKYKFVQNQDGGKSDDEE